MDKELFRNQFLAVIERDGYVFSREVRCDGKIVSLLPFRKVNDKLEYLARLEICPAHGPELELCSITGGVEQGETFEATALQELWEEAGYQINAEGLISLGRVRPSKSTDTVVHLFAVDVSEKLQSRPKGDGTKFEAGSSIEWVNYKQGIQIEDPLFVTAMTRLLNLLQAG